MKKVLLLLAAVFIAGCSSDSEKSSGCDVEVWDYQKTCMNTDCTYTVSYGEDENQTATVEVSEATYNYYKSKEAQEVICWEGATAH